MAQLAVMVDLLARKYCECGTQVAVASSWITLIFIFSDMYPVIDIQRGFMRQAMELSYVFSCGKLGQTFGDTTNARAVYDELLHYTPDEQ